MWHLSPQSYFNQGNDKYESGDYQGAVSDYDKAIQLDPQFANAYYNRGHAKNELGDFEDAALDYGEVIKRNSRDAQAYYARAFVRHRLEDATAVQGDIAKVNELDRNLDQTEAGRIRKNAAAE